MYGGLPPSYPSGPPDSLVTCNRILDRMTQAYIKQAALLAHAHNHTMAAATRERAGYGRCND